MIIKIALKDTFRNLRFILFTILFPVVFYLFMVNVVLPSSTHVSSDSFVALVLCCSVGVAGNALITFAKKLNATLAFYQLQASTSRYSMLTWARDQLIVQVILNIVICLAVVATAVGTGTFHYQVDVLVALLLVLIMGFYLCVVGLMIALLVDARTLDALSMPIMTLNAILVIPYHQWLQGPLVTIITPVQRVFPGYYLMEITQQISQHQDIGVSSSLFMVTLIPVLIVGAFVVRFNNLRLFPAKY